MQDKPGGSRTDASGLRYIRKVCGTPFRESHEDSSRTMSCFLCGKHRPRTLLQSRKLVGRHHFVCAPSCRELREQLEQRVLAGAKPGADT
jgi:hypothetical protein